MKLLEHFKELSLHPKNVVELKGMILKLAVKGKLSNLASDYQQIPLSELGAWAIGSGFPKSEQGLNNMEILFAKVSDMNLKGNERFINTTNNSISKETALKIRAKIHPKGTVIFPKIGGAIATNKRRIIIQDTCIDNNCLGIIPKENVLHEWLFLVLSSIDFTEYQTGTSVPALSQKIIGEINVSCPSIEEQKAVVEVVNTLFKEVEQLESLTKERIQLKESFVVSALTRLTEAENTQQEWNFLQQHFSSFFTEKKNIKSLRKTLLQLAVQGKLTEIWREKNTDVEPASDLFNRIEESKNRLIEQKIFKAKYDTDKFEPLINRPEIPNSWIYVTVGNICELITGATPSKSQPQYFGGNIKWLVSGDIHKGYIHDCEGRITDEGMSSSNCKVLPIDSIMIALNGQGKTRATVALLKTEATCNQSLVAMKPFMDNGTLSEYIYYLLKGKYFQIREITGQKQRRGLNMTLVSQLPIALPPLEEQKAIVNKVSSLMELCDELEQQIESSNIQIEQLMQSCLKEVFDYESN